MDKTATQIISILDTLYPNPASELQFGSPFELLVAVILSAQCTDARVNVVTKKLFSTANTPAALAQIPQEKLEKLIFSCGFYKTKSKNLLLASKSICSDFGGEVPKTLSELKTLAGVGQKTANVVYAVAFGGAAIAVDTHVFRVSNRLGLVRAANVADCERQLMQRLDKNLWSKAHHQLLLLGRYICKSRSPNCPACPLTQHCAYFAANSLQLRKQ